MLFGTRSSMAAPTAIVIVRPEHLTSVKKRLAGAAGMAVCSEADSLNVQAAMQSRPPEILVIHSAFAATSRGATLVAGLKARPNETGTNIRVFIEDDDKAPLLISQGTLSPDHALLETSRPLDRAGTRQAARYPMHRRAVVLNGEAAQLVDLSVSGAQVQVPMRLRPSQVVRFAMNDETGDTRCQGTVAWSIAVPSGGSIQYRVGVEFINPDQKRLALLCTRYGGAPDPTLGTT
jgi:hypothetical protein